VSKRLITSFATACFVAASIFAAPVMAKDNDPPEPKGTKKCEKGKKCLHDDLTTEEIYYAGYWLAKTGHYADAVFMLNKAAVKDERILTYIGFATRKLGDHDAAMPYYARALEMNPNYTIARAYLGEAYLAKGEVTKAKLELGEIAVRCGTSCEEHAELAAEIAKVSY
jgi:tetratricopeptide (TPR) repeat protein